MESHCVRAPPQTSGGEGSNMDVHDGNILFFQGTYFMYGVGYGNCVVESSWFPPRQCPGIWEPIGACGFRTDHKINLYRSSDLTHWDAVGDVLPSSSRPEGVYFRPKVIWWKDVFHLFVNFLPSSHPNTSSYFHSFESSPIRAYTRSLILKGVSKTVEGPFVLQKDGLVLHKSSPGDFDIFPDMSADRIFIAYSAWSTNHKIRIEELDASLVRTHLGRGTTVSPSNMEAPILFRRNRTYFLLFGKICCFCAEGAGARVYTSSDALSGWVDTGTDLFPKLEGWCGSRDVQGQNNAIFSIQGLNKEFVYTADIWHSARDGKKSHDAKFWAKMSFQTAENLSLPYVLRESESGVSYMNATGHTHQLHPFANSAFRCQNSNLPHPVLMLLMAMAGLLFTLCAFGIFSKCATKKQPLLKLASTSGVTLV